MPPINPTDVHTDRPVTNWLSAYPEQMFVAHRVAPIVPVDKESDEYYEIYPADRILQDTTRAPHTESKEVAFMYKSNSYSAKEFALHAPIPGRVLRNADNPLDPRKDAALTARAGVMLDIERRVAELAQATGLPKANATATWDNATLSNAKPAKDILTGRKVIRKKIGRNPNGIIIPEDCATALAIWLLEQKNGAGVEFATVEEYLRNETLPPYIWGMEVLTPGATYSSELDPEDVDLSSLSDIWGDKVTLFYKAPRPSVRMISFLYTLRVRNSEKARNGKYEGPRDPDDQWEEYCVTEAHETVSTHCAYMIENVLE